MPRFCDCSGDSIFILAKKPINEILEGTTNLGMKDIITCKNYKIENLGSEGKKIVELCADFLIFDKLKINFLKQNSENCFHKHKYIALWSFIYSYIGIEKNSGYDYWLMNFLDWNNICEHGSGIRCAWFNNDKSNPYNNRILQDEMKNSFIEWADNADDELNS